MTFNQVIEVLVSLAAIVGFFFGLYQYRQAQRWKRLEFAATQLQRLTSDPELLFAIVCLEYSKREVHLPEKYQKVIKKETFIHDSKVLSRVMQVYHEDTPEFYVYQDVFARLFEYLSQVYQFIDLGLIQANDVKGLRWVLEHLANPIFVDKVAFAKYIIKGGSQFEDVFKLMRIFGVVPPGIPTDSPSRLHRSSSP